VLKNNLEEYERHGIEVLEDLSTTLVLLKPRVNFSLERMGDNGFLRVVRR
jgi:hypothetical protein